MEEVGGHDSDEVGGPELEAWVILFDVDDDQGGVPEVSSRHCGCDELGLALGIL